MKQRILAAMALAIVLTLILWPLNALAQTVTVPVREPTLVETLLGYALQVVSIIVLAIIGYAATYFKTKWGIDIDQAKRDMLHKALMTGAQSVLASRGITAASVAAVPGAAANLAPEAIQAARALSPDTVKSFEGKTSPDTFKAQAKTIVAAKVVELAEAPSAPAAKPKG